MSEAVNKVRRRLFLASSALNEARVPYAVIGGNAVAAWVSRVNESAARNTRDVDLLLRREDLAAATAALQKAGFQHPRASLGQKGAMDVFLEAPESRVGDGVHVIFAQEKIRDDQPELNADVDESEEAAGFRLISLEALVRMKLSAFLDQDRVHLRDLVSVGLVEASWLARLSPELQMRLQLIIESPEG